MCFFWSWWHWWWYPHYFQWKEYVIADIAEIDQEIKKRKDGKEKNTGWVREIIQLGNESPSESLGVSADYICESCNKLKKNTMTDSAEAKRWTKIYHKSQSFARPYSTEGLERAVFCLLNDGFYIEWLFILWNHR